MDTTALDCIYPIQIKPEFQGSSAETFSKWVADHQEYPDSSWFAGVEGRVITQFTIDEEGHLGNVRVFRGINPELDAEAIRVIESAPQDWTPGYWITTHEPVKTTYTFPVIFKLPVSYFTMEDKPTFQNGTLSDFSHWVALHIEFPPSSRDPHGDFRIMVGFIINQTGEITNIRFLNEADSYFREPIHRALEEAPNWEPGHIDGEPVPVRIIMPIIFRLK